MTMGVNADLLETPALDVQVIHQRGEESRKKKEKWVDK